MRPAAILWACVAGLGFATAAFSLTRAEMYQATAPVSDRSEAAQTAAFQNAMRTVLIRVTGRRSADDDPNLSQLVARSEGTRLNSSHI